MTISLAPEPLFFIGTIPITNTLIVAWVIALFFLIGALIFRSRPMALVPVGAKNALEYLTESALTLIEDIAGSRERALKFFPIVFTIFIFVLASNWVELVPGLGSVGVYQVHHGKEALVPFIRSASADLNFTLAIALFAVAATWIMGIRETGLLGHLQKFFNFKNPIQFFVGILELISEFAKVISFSFRLFGNIFAGEVLLLVVAFLVPYIAPVPFLFLELFVGLVQAVVFSMLTLVFLKMATVHHS